MWRSTTLVALTILFAVPAYAEYKFDLVQDDSTVLATMTLGSFDVTEVPDVVSLVFSEAGEELFGFGPVYQGSFDRFLSDEGPHFILTADGLGLNGRTADGANGVVAVDLDPPPSSLLEGIVIGSFEIAAREIIGAPDHLQIRYEDGSGPTQVITGRGTWTLVPEPTSVSLIVCGLVCGLRIGRRRLR